MVVAPCRHWTDRLAARKKKEEEQFKVPCVDVDG